MSALVLLFFSGAQGLRLVQKSSSIETSKPEYSLESHCKFLYVDIGSNIGVQIRKLFEPASYPEAKVLPVFNEHFGTANARGKPSAESGICAIGLEANPQFEERLRTVEKHHRENGWNTKFFVPRIVSNDDNSNMTFYVDGRASKNHWGSSTNKAQAQASSSKEGEIKAVSVSSIDISNFFKSTILREEKKKVIAKMDIEGSEYIVLPKMLEAGLLCAGKIDAMFLEWHKLIPQGYDQGLTTRKALSANLKKQIAAAEHCAGAAPMQVLDIDDESYLTDGVPLSFSRVQNLNDSELFNSLEMTTKIYAEAQKQLR